MPLRPFYDSDPFFVQVAPRGLWHVEEPDDCEKMLCGLAISVDHPTAKVQTHWGLKPCPWCLHKFKLRAPDHAMAQGR